LQSLAAAQFVGDSWICCFVYHLAGDVDDIRFTTAKCMFVMASKYHGGTF